MKKLLFPIFAVSSLLLGSCSTSHLAQENDNDDVYFTKAKAREIQLPVVNAQEKPEKTYRTDEQLYGGNNYNDERYNDDYNYDYGYASRLNRFYSRSPWRSSYYDSWYSYGYYPWYTYRYDPFFYDPWYYSPGNSFWVGIGTFPRYSYYNNWGYYGAPYGSHYWGPTSYYNSYPGYSYGGYYGGYSGRRNNANYRERPSRGGNDTYNTRGTIITGGEPRSSTKNDGRVSGSDYPSDNARRPRATGQDYGYGRGERQPSTSSTRETQPAPRVERPAPVERSAPAPSSYGGGSNGGGGSSSGGEGSRPRPSRGGN